MVSNRSERKLLVLSKRLCNRWYTRTSVLRGLNSEFNRNTGNLTVFLADRAENAVTCSLSVGYESFHSLYLPFNETNTLVVLDFKSETLCFSVESQHQSLCWRF